MRKFDLAKLVFILALALVCAVFVFGVGIYSGYKRNGIYRFIDAAWSDVKLVYNEAGILRPGGHALHYLQPSRQPGEGVTINERADDGALILISGFFDGGNELRLLRRDGSIVARWPVSFSALFPDVSYMEEAPKTDFNVDLHGALIRPDGSVVFNFEYGGTAKLGRCGETVWTLRHPTHHSIETAEGGGYWIPGRNFLYADDPEGFPPFTRQNTDKAFEEDLILRVSEDGEIVGRISVPRLFYDNGLETLLTATGQNFDQGGIWDRELLHLNKIEELPSAMAPAFPMFEAGDLLLSIRDYNLLLVVDPDDLRVKWRQTGPWRRQHDPEFDADGTISMFNNNTYRTDLPSNGRSNPKLPRVSNILKVDPATGATEVVYGERPGQEFYSTIRGKEDPTPEGGFFITEFEAGRVFEVDAQGRIVWEYINRYDETQVLEVTEARLYPSAYFSVEDWSCPETTASK